MLLVFFVKHALLEACSARTHNISTTAHVYEHISQRAFTSTSTTIQLSNMSSKPCTIYQTLMYCSKQNHFLLQNPGAQGDEHYRESRIGDIGYCQDGTFVTTRPVEEYSDAFAWTVAGFALEAGIPKFAGKLRVKSMGVNPSVGVNLPPLSTSVLSDLFDFGRTKTIWCSVL
ncbi:hypothetical protein BT69DRAFT_717818 [Atractiella rhizophila]|nr:hypothetical protein BT69DRAFT_717818 [Atractiella rhizophila]